MDFASWAKDNLIVRVVAGSRLYGTHGEASDFDFRGVCLDPPSAILGIHRFDQYENVTKSHDEVIYGASKFIKLSLDANPSILDILFAPDDAILYSTPTWEAIRKSANSLLSQKIRHTFSGYAFSQLKRIERHKKWIDSPPPYPNLKEFGLSLQSTPGGGQRFEPIPQTVSLTTRRFPFVNLAALRKAVRRRSLLVPQDSTAMIARYKGAKSEYDKYMAWTVNRNRERAALESLYGYDTKHASHLVRLLLQCENILREGTYNPRLTGNTRRTVLDVLYGEWPYDGLVEFARERESIVKNMETSLPRTPNAHTASRLLRLVAATSLMKDDEFVFLLYKIGRSGT